MIARRAQNFIVRLVSVTLVGMCFVQSSSAGMIGTDYMIDRDAYAMTLDRIGQKLAQERITQQFEALGVDAAVVAQRLSGLSHAELAMLEAQLDKQIAGGDALAIIGAVFLVLLILEIVGVTDIFSGI